MSVLFPEIITIIQRSGNYDTNGVWTENHIQTSIVGDAQPMTDTEIEGLNIGRRELGKIKVYSNSMLNVAVDDLNGDMVLFNNEWYEVISQDVRQKLISHYKYIAELRKDFEIIEPVPEIPEEPEE